MSLVGSYTNIYAGEHRNPVLLLAGRNLLNFLYFFVLGICNGVYITRPIIHSYDVAETNMKIIFMTFCSIALRQFTIAPFIILLMSLVVSAYIDIMVEKATQRQFTMVKEAIQRHIEYCLRLMETNRR